MRTMCISHSQDIDGLICATLLKMAKNAEYRLADYPELLNILKKVDDQIDVLYICDLQLAPSLVQELTRIAKFAKIIYIDHHPLKNGLLNALKELNVQLIHSLDKCSGLLTYQLFEKELPEKAAILAAYATLSDYPYTNPETSQFLKRFDPHLLAFEYSTLYFSVSRKIDDLHFKDQIIKELSRFKYPHEIKDVVHLAEEQVKYPIDISRSLNDKVSFGKNLAYTEVLGSPSVVANTLMHMLKIPALICYSPFNGGEQYYLSIRSTNDDLNVGSLASELAKKLQGSGGGHPMAAAAQLPKKNFSMFIESFDNALEKFFLG